MSKPLTSEQIAAIATYQEKWWQKAIATEPLDRDRAEQNIRAAYAAVNEPVPRVVFCDSPYQGFLSVDWSDPTSNVVSAIGQLEFAIDMDATRGVGLLDPYTYDGWKIRSVSITFGLAWQQLRGMDIFNRLAPKDKSNAEECFAFELFEQDPSGFIYPTFLWWGAFFDFAFSVLNLQASSDRKGWENYNIKATFQALKDIGGWIFPRRKTCVVCDRPSRIALDEENRPHAIAKAAIEYADGFKIYAYHGVWMPEKYGKLPPSQWQPQWLLTEKNAECRRILLQEIGYDRICSELKPKILDRWREYALLEIENDPNFDPRDVDEYYDLAKHYWGDGFDTEPIYLLTMTCPSTDRQHIMRVPPNLTTAREAIRWVNWDIDPTEFGAET
ncbi:MAG: hypothetical protein J7647_04745 [Cyanobacteria bacterium SBLK]|nr:hypothetical protein [Cyanobacteria bacterium SBLK]